MLFKDITYIDENFNAVEHAYVGTKNGVIDYISTEKTDWGYGEVYDGRGKVLIPGAGLRKRFFRLKRSGTKTVFTGRECLPWQR